MDAQVVSFPLSGKRAFFLLVRNLDAKTETIYASTKQHAQKTM